MTGNIKLCCMVLPRLGFVFVVANSSVLACPVAFGKTVIVCIVKWPVTRASRFRGEVLCPVMW